MHISLRTKVLLWFLFVILAVGIAGLAGFRRLSGYIEHEAELQMTSKLEHVMDVLEATNSIYLDLVHSSMHVLRMLSSQQGEPRLVRSTDADGRRTETLYFGNRAVDGDFGIVDEVRTIMGGTATLFRREGDRFIRVATNVMDKNGQRAVGTELDPSGEAIKAILKGESFYGVVEILGSPYITGYKPIRDAAGTIIGVSYVGYALDQLSTIREAIQDRGVLDTGFFMLLDPEDQVIFKTRDATAPEEIRTIIGAATEGRESLPDWQFRRRTFVPWNYDVIAVLYLPDVTANTVRIIWQVYGVGGAIILGVLIVSFFLASKLSNALAVAESARQEALRARDAAESANRTKSTFLANMSHELRTPMNAIIGYSEILIEEAEDSGMDSLTPDLNKIRAAGKHLLSLINDVLDLSKIEAGKMSLFVEPVKINEMIRDVVSTIQPLIEKNGNKLDIRCPEDAGSMRADLTKIRQTLFNLLSNAAKFTEKGRITLAVERVPSDSGERIQFVVSDTGIGMTQEQMGRLFQAFSQADASTTRKFGGTGLGLVISRKFCQMMGGDITVESTYGTGTSFTVDLPVNAQESAPGSNESAPGPGAAAAGRKAVLVIDDDQDTADILKRNLAKSGYEVIVAHSGATGLELARKMKPAAITLDVMMPGMDGWSVLTALKADPATAAIPVIMVTMLQDRQLGFTLGAAEFLTKPVDQDKLRGVLAKYCGKPAAYALVVEDDPGNRQLICRMLDKENIRHAEAENGSVALEKVATEMPGLILLDLMMPVMDGFEFLSLLRRKPGCETIPVVVITAKDLTAEDRERLTGSVNQIIQKGDVDREKLLQNITSMLAEAEKTH